MPGEKKLQSENKPTMSTTPDPLTTEIHPDGYMVMTLSGDLSNERIETLHANVHTAVQMSKVYAETKGKPNILFDMSTFTGDYSVSALQVMVKFAEDTRPYARKVACFGGPDIGRIAGEMVVALSGRDNIQFFKTKEEALPWLLES